MRQKGPFPFLNVVFPDGAALPDKVFIEFYDRAFRAALSNPSVVSIAVTDDAAARHAAGIARAATEARFGVRLILPGDKE